METVHVVHRSVPAAAVLDLYGLEVPGVPEDGNVTLVIIAGPVTTTFCACGRPVWDANPHGRRRERCDTCRTEARRAVAARCHVATRGKAVARAPLAPGLLTRGMLCERWRLREDAVDQRLREAEAAVQYVPSPHDRGPSRIRVITVAEADRIAAEYARRQASHMAKMRAGKAAKRAARAVPAPVARPKSATTGTRARKPAPTTATDAPAPRKVATTTATASIEHEPRNPSRSHCPGRQDPRRDAGSGVSRATTGTRARTDAVARIDGAQTSGTTAPNAGSGSVHASEPSKLPAPARPAAGPGVQSVADRLKAALVAARAAPPAPPPAREATSPDAGPGLTPAEVVERVRGCKLFDVADGRAAGILVPIDPTAKPVRFTAESVAAFRAWRAKSRTQRLNEAPLQEWVEPRLDLRELGLREAR